MKIKDDIMRINAKMEISLNDRITMPKEIQKNIVKDILSNEIAKKIKIHFDELPLNHKIFVFSHTGNEMHKITMDIVNNLVPINIYFSGKPVEVYISRDKAKELNLINNEYEIKIL